MCRGPSSQRPSGSRTVDNETYINSAYNLSYDDSAAFNALGLAGSNVSEGVERRSDAQFANIDSVTDNILYAHTLDTPAHTLPAVHTRPVHAHAWRAHVGAVASQQQKQQHELDTYTLSDGSVSEAGQGSQVRVQVGYGTGQRDGRVQGDVEMAASDDSSDAASDEGGLCGGDTVLTMHDDAACDSILAPAIRSLPSASEYYEYSNAGRVAARARATDAEDESDESASEEDSYEDSDVAIMMMDAQPTAAFRALLQLQQPEAMVNKSLQQQEQQQRSIVGVDSRAAVSLGRVQLPPVMVSRSQQQRSIVGADSRATDAAYTTDEQPTAPYVFARMALASDAARAHAARVHSSTASPTAGAGARTLGSVQPQAAQIELQDWRTSAQGDLSRRFDSINDTLSRPETGATVAQDKAFVNDMGHDGTGYSRGAASESDWDGESESGESEVWTPRAVTGRDRVAADAVTVHSNAAHACSGTANGSETRAAERVWPKTGLPLSSVTRQRESATERSQWR